MMAMELTQETNLTVDKAENIPGSDAADGRLMSLDVLRGFDMFWITGGEELFHVLAKATGWAWVAAVTAQLDHAPWAGFKFYDLIFPLFVFISGATLPLSIGRRLERGERRARILGRMLRRALVLVLLGVIYNAQKISFEVSALRFGSVLGRIGLAGLGAGAIVLFTKSWGTRLAWVAAILLAYWALLTGVPVPGVGPASLDQGKNLADYVDQHFMPGKLYNQDHDPEGLLSTLPTVATALLGALAGGWLSARRGAAVKTLGLLAAGAALLGLGSVWAWRFPLIKNLWTSSFVLYTAGWSCVLLALFYAAVDVLRWRRWGFLFLLIGMNPLTIYFLNATELIDFDHLGHFFFGFLGTYAAREWVPVVQSLGVLTVQFVFLYWLYRRKVFIKI